MQTHAFDPRYRTCIHALVLDPLSYARPLILSNCTHFHPLCVRVCYLLCLLPLTVDATQGHAYWYKTTNCIIVHIACVMHSTSICLSHLNTNIITITQSICGHYHITYSCFMKDVGSLTWRGLLMLLLLTIFIWTFHMDFVLFHLFPFSFTWLSSSPCHTTGGPVCRLQSASPANVLLMSVVGPLRHASALSWALHGEGGYQIVNNSKQI